MSVRFLDLTHSCVRSPVRSQKNGLFSKSCESQLRQASLFTFVLSILILTAKPGDLTAAQWFLNYDGRVDSGRAEPSRVGGRSLANVNWRVTPPPLPRSPAAPAVPGHGGCFRGEGHRKLLSADNGDSRVNSWLLWLMFDEDGDRLKTAAACFRSSFLCDSFNKPSFFFFSYVKRTVSTPR